MSWFVCYACGPIQTTGQMPAGRSKHNADDCTSVLISFVCVQSPGITKLQLTGVVEFSLRVCPVAKQQLF